MSMRSNDGINVDLPVVLLSFVPFPQSKLAAVTGQKDREYSRTWATLAGSNIYALTLRL